MEAMMVWKMAVCLVGMLVACSVETTAVNLVVMTVVAKVESSDVC